MTNRNVEFGYIYRDGDNYKRSGGVVFAGDVTDDELDALEAQIRESLSEELWFIAHQVRVPEAFLWEEDLEYDDYPEELKGSQRYKINDSDHVWHEFTVLRPVEREPTDSHGRTIHDFVEELETAAEEGWLDCWMPGMPRP